MARAGAAEGPPVEPPRPLRPLLRFTRLPRRGADIVRRVLDEDLAFRARVTLAAAGFEDELGPASTLFLVRPDGWEDQLNALAEEVDEAAAVAEESAAEAKAERRLRKAGERLARLEAEVDGLRRREAEAEAELAVLRRARNEAAERADGLEQALTAERGEAARLRQALEEARARAEAEAKAVDVAGSDPAPAPPFDVAALGAALVEAGDSARAVARALDDAIALVADSAAGADASSGASPPVGRPAPSARSPRPGRTLSAAPVARRRPVALPPGLRDDSPEAAQHLVRANGVVLIVDGYNATLSAWPELPLPEQRRRLVDALAELAARTGADVQVVFDGSQDSPGPAAVRDRARPARSPVRVLFSPVDVAADDVILELADGVAAHRPVVVASDDREVQDGARLRGAGVIGRAQLLGVLRRGPSSALGLG